MLVGQACVYFCRNIIKTSDFKVGLLASANYIKVMRWCLYCHVPCLRGVSQHNKHVDGKKSLPALRKYMFLRIFYIQFLCYLHTDHGVGLPLLVWKKCLHTSLLKMTFLEKDLADKLIRAKRKPFTILLAAT